ncbi:DUF3514 domain-containing protein [Ehrlichia ruminantium]|uniref:DUF3514 domain-containing protein n=1 Tax=Ehrlichia ruminantium TaxID=779 RepID=UPI000995DA60|nr:DUF3514 domain-containing protein [Ehrlichia ruminantium]
MGILKLLMGIIGTGMVLTGSTGDSEQKEDKENTDSQSSKDQSDSNLGVANTSGDNTSTQSSQCIGNSEGNIAAGGSENVNISKELVSHAAFTVRQELKCFRKKHAEYCYNMLQAAFSWQNSYAYVTNDFSEFLNCIAGNDQETRGLCFLVLKASLLFQYCIVHSHHESARLIIFDQRSIRDPSLLNSLLSNALRILSSTRSSSHRMHNSYFALSNMSYSQYFPNTKEMISPQFYRDVQKLLCKIFEYKITNGFDKYIRFTDELLIGCALFMGSMYNQIYIRTEENITESGFPKISVLYRNTDVFRDKIGSHTRSLMALQDLGYRCYKLFITMLYMYRDITPLFRRGIQSIPQKLVRQCSEDIMGFIDNNYRYDDMPYSVITRNIASNLGRLINRVNIRTLEQDIQLYEQHCIMQCLMSVETSTDLESQDMGQLNVEMSSININEAQEATHDVQHPSSSSVEGAMGVVADVKQDEIDYTKLGARPKVRSKRSSDKTLKQDESHASVQKTQVSTGTSGTSVDKKSQKLVGTIDSSGSSSGKLSDTGLHEGVLQSVCTRAVKQLPVSEQSTGMKTISHEQIRKFRCLHVKYLHSVCRRVMFSMYGEIKPTFECVQLMSYIFQNNEYEKRLCLLVFKISMLLQFCGAHFCREQIRYLIFDERPWIEGEEHIDYILYNILGVINASAPLATCITLVNGLLRQKFNISRQMLTRCQHTPDFYRKIMNLLCKVYQCRRECSNFSRGSICTIMLNEIIMCCSLLMGSMYCNMKSMGIRDCRRKLDVECYRILLAFMYMYEVRYQGINVEYVDHDPVIVPQALSRVCSEKFIEFLKANYSDGEVPFSMYVEHLIERLDMLMTSRNVTWIFDDIGIYESSFITTNSMRNESDHSRRDDTGGKNDNFPYQQRASGDGRGL